MTKPLPLILSLPQFPLYQCLSTSLPLFLPPSLFLAPVSISGTVSTLAFAPVSAAVHILDPATVPNSVSTTHTFPPATVPLTVPVHDASVAALEVVASPILPAAAPVPPLAPVESPPTASDDQILESGMGAQIDNMPDEAIEVKEFEGMTSPAVEGDAKREVADIERILEREDMIKKCAVNLEKESGRKLTQSMLTSVTELADAVCVEAVNWALQSVGERHWYRQPTLEDEDAGAPISELTPADVDEEHIAANVAIEIVSDVDFDELVAADESELLPGYQHQKPFLTQLQIQEHEDEQQFENEQYHQQEQEEQEDTGSVSILHKALGLQFRGNLFRS